jgi:stromal membrane-associated protein
MSLPENQVCSDCPERQPRWASLIVPPPGSPPGSLAIGALCCLECSGSHRRLGVHIAFVRSITLDSWKEKEVLAMENGGNAKVNAIFEANLHSASAKPTAGASGPVRERFIRDKYERRKFYDPSVMQEYADAPPPQASTASGRTAQNVITPTRRAPSDAARLRAQNRRIAAPKIPSGPPPPPPPPPPRAAPDVDLLDFSTTTTDMSAPPNPPSAGPSPTLGMFKSMSMTGGGNVQTQAGNGNNGGMMRNQTSPAMGSTSVNLAPQMEGKMSSDDILAMFHAPSPAQQNFGNFNNASMNGGMNNTVQGMPGGNMQMSSMLMNQQQQMMRNNMMNNKNMMQNNNNMMQNNNNMMNINNNNMMQTNNNNMMGNSNANMNMGMGMNQNNMMMNQQSNNNMMPQQNLFGGMQQNNMMGGKGMNGMGMNHNSFGGSATNSTMQQQQPMGGMPTNLNMMGGNGMNQVNQAHNMGGNSTNDQSSNQNFQGNMNGNMGAFDTSSVMGGSGNTQQNQFASFGSFR